MTGKYSVVIKSGGIYSRVGTLFILFLLRKASCDGRITWYLYCSLIGWWKSHEKLHQSAHILIGWQKSHETFHQPGHISNWQIGTTWLDSSVSIHSYWMIRGHINGHECPLWEPWFLLAVENQMEVFCGNTYSNHFHINIRWPMTSCWCHIVMSCCIIYLFLSSSVCIC